MGGVVANTIVIEDRMNTHARRIAVDLTMDITLSTRM